MICPLHGPSWRTNLDYFLDKYDKWSSYTPEKNGVVLFYASMYGNTENVVNAVANKLAEKGVEDMRVFDVSKTHPSYIIAEVWKYSHMVVASPSYNSGLYHVMDALLHELTALNIQKRKVGIIGNYTWASSAIKVITEHVSKMKDTEIIGDPLEVNSSMKEQEEEKLNQFVDAIYNSLNN